MDVTASTSSPDLENLLHGVGIAILPTRAFLQVTGPDATRWLNGMVTNSVQALAPGEGNYNFLLNAQGRIQGDCTVYRVPNSPADPAFILATSTDQVNPLQSWLERYIIMDDVELAPTLDEFRTVLLAGPAAAEMMRALHGVLGDDHAELPPLRLAYDGLNSDQVTTPAAGLVPRFEIRANGPTIDRLRQTALAHGAVQVSPEALDALRILEGTPMFGTDIRERDLPQETNQDHALHFAKGCYLGQEIVERIRSRGQVHRVFSAFLLEGSLPTLPAPIESEGKVVGELTSAAQVSLPGSPALLALGYARREALDTRAKLTYAGGVLRQRPLPRSLQQIIPDGAQRIQSA